MRGKMNEKNNEGGRDRGRMDYFIDVGESAITRRDQKYAGVIAWAKCGKQFCVNKLW